MRSHVKHQLRSRLPEKLTSAILTGERYHANHDEYGRIDAVIDPHGELYPKETAAIKGDKHTLAHALAELNRSQAPDERKAELRAEFELAEPGTWIDVVPGYRIHRAIDWSEVKFRASLSDRPVTHDIPLGIAYLYLALCLGEKNVYDDALVTVRQALKRAIDGDPTDARALLPADQRMVTGKVEPMHFLSAKNVANGVRVTFTVFRDLTWPIDFPRVRIGGDQMLYVVDLENRWERWCSKLPGAA